MKKLMIAAAVAAMGVSVFADNNCSPGQTKTDEAWVYVWKFTGKTTVGTLKSTATGNSCTPGNANCIVRIPGKVNIQGYTYHCNPACTDFVDIDASGADDIFWATKPEKSAITGQSIAFSLANLMGKNKKEYEVAGVATFPLVDLENETFTLNFAGQGKYAGNHPTAISGYFAGSSDNTYYVTSKGIDTDADDVLEYCLASQPWDCVTLDCAAATASAAFGSWSVKFNSAAAKKYAKDGTVLKVPSWL